MRSPILPALLCALVLYGCGATTVKSLVKDQGAVQMTGHEVLRLVKGNTLALHSFSDDVQLYFDPAGKIFAKGVSTDKDKGRWDVSENGELCMRMEKWWYSDLRCFTVYHIGDMDKVRLANTSGVLQYSAEQTEGDSKGLYSGMDKKKKSLRRSIRNEADTQQPSTSLSASPSKATTPALIEEPRPSAHHGGKDTGVMVEYMAKDCPGCDLAGVDLGRAELIDAKLAGADLHGANLSMANLRRADLKKANLQKAVLTYANLPGADLRGADLRGASLKGANLIKADLTGARLEEADLTEVLKEGAKGLK
mgnify:CR=1 FL=1